MLFKNLITVGSLVAITGLTLATTVYGSTKAADVFKISLQKNQLPIVKSTAEVEAKKQINDDASAEQKSTNSVTAKNNTTGTSAGKDTQKNTTQNAQKTGTQSSSPTPSPTKTKTPETSPSASPTTAPNPNQCVITLFGKKYDVAPLRTQHGGGNIFVCNTDMSAAYQSQHGTNVSSMAKYILTSDTAGSSSGTSNTGSGKTSTSPSTNLEHSEDDEHEDNEVEDMSDEDHEDEQAREAAKKRAEAEREAQKTESDD